MFKKSIKRPERTHYKCLDCPEKPEDFKAAAQHVIDEMHRVEWR